MLRAAAIAERAGVPSVSIVVVYGDSAFQRSNRRPAAPGEPRQAPGREGRGLVVVGPGGARALQRYRVEFIRVG